MQEEKEPIVLLSYDAHEPQRPARHHNTKYGHRGLGSNQQLDKKETMPTTG